MVDLDGESKFLNINYNLYMQKTKECSVIQKGI